MPTYNQFINLLNAVPDSGVSLTYTNRDTDLEFMVRKAVPEYGDDKRDLFIITCSDFFAPEVRDFLCEYNFTFYHPSSIKFLFMH